MSGCEDLGYTQCSHILSNLLSGTLNFLLVHGFPHWWSQTFEIAQNNSTQRQDPKQITLTSVIAELSQPHAPGII